MPKCCRRRLYWARAAISSLLNPLFVVAFEVALNDRFRPSCPADIESIRQFEPSLVDCSTAGNDHVWVAVFRSQNNKPSVFVRDEFLHAMQSATDALHHSTASSDPSILGSFSTTSVGASSAPVAVARLRPADDCSSFVLDSMRCILVKENTDTSCDGGSEHTEALATAIDALVHHYLTVKMAGVKDLGFEGAIRTKATLYSAPLLEDRGFRPVSELQKDMTTHLSSLDNCLERYAERSVSCLSKSPGVRLRAVGIVSQLGRIDRAADLDRARHQGKHDGDEEEYNPWANRFF